ncbi:mediator of RNA polymerase II transcription subunit 19a-like [Nicotiana sylvestris]|uniref:Mediator of RNA polymerase II transcription subunit 19a n=2 Tax=Nicotiana TaxID=4085 RepID=A0A1S4C487_TOBAC|nr:PREDICTED: mediator of RNA polymerase II transcription subunit 19a-like [Nicotiana sylvestris]XP_016495945.1 PREDICTED: mediator of RNA polymerase II transcription subunit 19a-like [Nicotiana tabacum]
MDPDIRKFGRGPRELGGSVDLLNHCKLRKHLDLFCKRSLPLSISETQYLRNVVGDTEIRKGEGMELDQLSQNSPYVGHRCVQLRPFGLDLLTDAFQLREATSTDLPLAEIGFPIGASKLKNECKEKKKHKKHKHKDRSRKHDPSSCTDKEPKPSRVNNKEKNESKSQNYGPDLFLRQQVKKPRTDGNGGFSGILTYQKNELNKAFRRS